jgi:hypothetical protein
VNEVHVYHHHAAPSRVRVKLAPSCFGRGGFPEYVPDELRGRVADGDYVAHIRQLNSDLSRAGRWGWGALPCLVTVMVGIIGGSITFGTSLSHTGVNEMPSLSNLLPWGVVTGLSIIGIAFFSIFSSLKTASVLRYHVNHLNETLGVDAGLSFSIKWKVKKDKNAQKIYDSARKQYVRPKRTKVTLIIDIGPLPTASHLQPASPAEIDAAAYDAAPPAGSYPAPPAYVQEAGPTVDNPKLLMV